VAGAHKRRSQGEADEWAGGSQSHVFVRPVVVLLTGRAWEGQRELFAWREATRRACRLCEGDAQLVVCRRGVIAAVRACGRSRRVWVWPEAMRRGGGPWLRNNQRFVACGPCAWPNDCAGPRGLFAWPGRRVQSERKSGTASHLFVRGEARAVHGRPC
jgi:hypothetical protein